MEVSFFNYFSFFPSRVLFEDPMYIEIPKSSARARSSPWAPSKRQINLNWVVELKFEMQFFHPQLESIIAKTYMSR